MAWFKCIGNSGGGGVDYNVNILHEMILPDAYTNVDKTLPDYQYKSYGLYVEYNGTELIPIIPLVKAGESSSFFQWYFYDPNNSSNRVQITVTFSSTYVRFRLGSVGGNIPLSGTNLVAKFFTTDIDVDSLLSSAAT